MRATPSDRRLISLLVTAGACASPNDSAGTDDGSTSGAAEATSAAETATSAAETTSSSAESSTSSAETTSSSAESSTSSAESSGTQGSSDTSGGECAPGLESADFTEVAGCPEPIGTAFCSDGAMHVPQDAETSWSHDPPHSGQHYPSWETWGEHPIPVARGNWVHNLEHGGVVLATNCQAGCEPELETLRTAMAMRPDARVLMTADGRLPGPERFAAISWTWVERFDAPELDRILCFVDQHEGHAPEDVP